jgi:hypothetical protein
MPSLSPEPLSSRFPLPLLVIRVLRVPWAARTVIVEDVGLVPPRGDNSRQDILPWGDSWRAGLL